MEFGKFNFLTLLEKFNKIEIPIIQRNYAQGRKKESYVRNNFITKIYEVLTSSKEEKLNLDFIYGTVNNDRFIPIDGQQRLTTLFLLYWYIFINCSSEDKERYIEKLSKFTYATRETSNLFCEKLVKNYKVQHNTNTIDENIKDQIWFLQEWNNDPTIESMLIMLCTIEDKFKGADFEKIKKRLNEDIIYFYFIEIENFGTPEDLYIKMNSRGKPLTTFEKFKSKLEAYMENMGKNKSEGEIYINFGKYLDENWLKYFWEIFKEKNQNENRMENIEVIDKWMMNLFITIFENYYIINCEKENKKEKEIIEKFDAFARQTREELNFEELERLKCINKDTIEQIYYVLQYFCNRKDIDLDDYSKFVNKKELLKTIINTKSVNNIQKCYKIEFYAMCKYIYIKNKQKEEIEELELSKILYFVRNLSENMYIDNVELYSKIIKLVDRIIIEKNISNVFEALKNIDIKKEDKEISNKNILNLLQVEKNKAKYITSTNRNWEKEILKMDSNSYFNGNTGFVFEFVNNFLEERNANETRNEDLEIEQYTKYSHLIRSIFLNCDNTEDLEDDSEQKRENEIDFDPILNSENENNKFYFKRALLCYGSYLYKVSGRYSFLMCSDSDKYHSWKKLLNPGENEKRKEKDVIRKFLDEFDKNNSYVTGEKEELKLTRKSLEQWIPKFLNEKIKELDKQDKEGKDVYTIGKWENYCIKFSKLISLVKEERKNTLGYLNIRDDDKTIYIMRGKNTSSYNWNFYTYALKLRLEDELKNKKIKITELKCEPKKTADEQKPIEYEDFIKMDYVYDGQEAYYTMEFDLNKITKEKIDNILKKESKQDNNKRIYKFDTEKEIIEKFIEIIEAKNEIKK